MIADASGRGVRFPGARHTRSAVPVVAFPQKNTQTMATGFLLLTDRFSVREAGSFVRSFAARGGNFEEALRAAIRVATRSVGFFGAREWMAQFEAESG
jgi:hypothetical protein